MYPVTVASLPVLLELGSSLRFWMIFSSISEMTLLETRWVETGSEETITLWLLSA